MKRSIRSATRLTAALAVLAAWGGTTRADNNQCPGSCPETWISNIHHKCNPAGVACGVGCVCRNVRGDIWSDCYCLKPGVTGKPGGCLSGGGWDVLAVSGALNPGATVTCQLAFTPGNQLEVFSEDDIGPDPDGTVLASTILNAPGDFQGTLVLRALNGPPDMIPIEMVSLNLVSASVPIGPLPSGTNTITLGPGPMPQGLWNSTTGRIEFDIPIPITVQNSLYPAGLPALARPSFEGPVGFGVTQWLMLPHGVIPLPATGIPTVSEWGMIIIGVGLLSGGVFAMRWFGRAM